MYRYNTLAVTPADAGGVMEVGLNRPDKLNAMNNEFWRDLKSCFERADGDTSVRCIILHQVRDPRAIAHCAHCVVM
jgi:enoyl-CoA hydratase/carnithine racemase